MVLISPPRAPMPPSIHPLPLSSSFSALWLLPFRGLRPTLDPSPRRKSLETSYLYAQSFHPSHRPTLDDRLLPLSFCQLLFFFATSLPRCSVLLVIFQATCKSPPLPALIAAPVVGAVEELALSCVIILVLLSSRSRSAPLRYVFFSLVFWLDLLASARVCASVAFS
jgi:hypothetical protein